MKIKNILIILISFLILSAGCQTLRPSSKQPRIDVTIQKEALDEVGKKLPQSVTVYEVLRPDPKATLDHLRELTAMKGKASETEDLLRIQEEDRYLEVRKISGAVFYGEMSKLWKEEPIPEKRDFDLPDNEKATEITLKVLESFGFKPEDRKNLEISVSDEVFEFTYPKREGEVIRAAVGKNVTVRQRIDGLLVFGPGSKIKLYLGPKGAVSGYTAVWRQIDPASEAMAHKAIAGKPKGIQRKPISPEAAFRKLKQNPLDHLPLALVYKINIDKVQFGYYGRSATEEQRYLQPVYVFSGTAFARTNEGREMNVPYTQYVVALDEPVESIWPPTKSFKEQPRSKFQKLPQGDQDEK